jgi:hypothetical protein
LDKAHCVEYDFDFELIEYNIFVVGFIDLCVFFKLSLKLNYNIDIEVEFVLVLVLFQLV